MGPHARIHDDPDHSEDEVREIIVGIRFNSSSSLSAS